MTLDRISLQEAYDNRDVIAWLVRHQDRIDELFNSMDAWLVPGNNIEITDNPDNTRTIDLKSRITGPITFSDAITCNSYITSVARAYAAVNVNDVITIGSLAVNPSVLHTVGSEEKSGNLTLLSNLFVKNATIDTTTVPSGYQSIKDYIACTDANGEMIARIRRDRDVSYDRTMFLTRYYDRAAGSWNTCELQLQAGQNNTVNLILRKTVGGTSTQTTVATL